MEDKRMELIRDFQADMIEHFSEADVKVIIDNLVMRLASYDVHEAETGLTVTGDENERMLNVFLATKRLEGRSDKTIARYSYEIKRLINELGIPTSAINVYHIRHYFASLESKGVTINTISGIRSIFCSYFSWLFNEHLIENDPTAQLRPIKKIKQVKLPYTMDDVEKLRSECTNERDRAIIEFLNCTGCRIEEVHRLNVSDVDLKNLECKVYGKGGKERVVYIDEVCALHLDWYIRSRTDDSPALFVGRGSDRLTPGAMRAMLKRISTKAGVANVHPHRFRRTMATNLIRHGMPVQNVGRILGHSNLNTTLTYTYIDDMTLRNEYRKFAA